MTWKKDASQVPNSVEVDRRTVRRQDIIALLSDFDPRQTYANVKIYEVPEEVEGKIFYQANNLTRVAATSVGLDLTRGLTPESRFIYTLMERSPVLAEAEVERRFTKIGDKSRKVTTISTLVESAKVMNARLQYLERSDEFKYFELIDFVAAFIDEYARHYPEWLQSATMQERQQLRQRSFAMSNIMVHGLFRLAFRLFEDMEKESKDWRGEAGWKASVAKLARKLEIEADDGRLITIDPMDQRNPAWRGRILTERVSRKTGQTAWDVVNRRQTRQAAYEYLCDLAGVRS